MTNLSTAFLIIALVIVVNQGSGVTGENDFKVDQVAEETKNRALTIIDGPKYVAQPKPNLPPIKIDVQTPKPELRPPSKPPIKPDKKAKQNYYVDIPRPYYSQIQKIPPRHYLKPKLTIHRSPNSIYKFPRVIPLPHHKNHFYVKESRPIVFAASIGRPSFAKSPKFSLPVQTINGIPTDYVRPPQLLNISATTTTTVATTTTRVLRTKRIWPKRVSGENNSTSHNTTVTKDNSTKTNLIADDTEHDTSASFHRIRYKFTNATASTTSQPSTTRSYRPVTRVPKLKSTTQSSINFTSLGPNEWVPIIPSHYPKLKRPNPTPISKRSDVLPNSQAPSSKRMLYLQSFGLLPMNSQSPPSMERKKMVFFKRKRQLNPYYSGYSPKFVRSPMPYIIDLHTEGSRRHPRVVTKIKHHHHHHHHQYIKTVKKPVKVPYKVEVPKPYPVTVEKKVPVHKIKVVDRPVPYPVTVEKKVPYPIGIRVPHPVPVKVIQNKYIPKPYPVVQQVPVLKHVHHEKKVPYPVEVKVPYPVDRPVPVQVMVEKRVPYPVPVKVLVPQPYPVEKKVPYPVEVTVKEPYEVIKHVPVRVPYPQPYPVGVLHPVRVEVEKKVPYPVEVEKKVPVPVEVYVPQRVEVEKKVPVYVPRPYPVEKRVPVPYPVRVPVNVPVQVPVEVPIYIHHGFEVYGDREPQYESRVASENTVTETPQHTVTVHGNTGFKGFKPRSDNSEAVTSIPSKS